MKTCFIRTIALFALIWISYPILYAQKSDTIYLRKGEKGKIAFASFQANEKSDRKMQNDTVFLKAVLQAKPSDEFRLKSVTTDKLGITHKRFQQYYKGIKVESAEYLLHGKDDNIEYMNGDFQDVNIQSIDTVLNEQQALLKALEYTGAKKYKWEDPAMEAFIKQLKNNPNATYYPQGELVISKDYLTGGDSCRLSWKFAISSLQPNDEQMIFVDANNGEIIRADPLILKSGNYSGTAQTLYSGLQNITCFSYTSEYVLREIRNTIHGKSVTIQTLNSTPWGVDFSNTNANWTSGSWATFAQQRAALDIHWGTEKVLDYWSSVHSRDGIDRDSVPNIMSYVSCDFDIANADWSSFGHFMRYYGGNGTDLNAYASLDIVAHEMGHGITQFTAGLSYVDESGALNEGFSDIWGACVENYVGKPLSSLWLLGSEIMTANSSFNCIRNMQDPKSNSAWEGHHPSKYKGQYWDLGNEPHFNSTVLSHWFYLLCQGGIGTNEGIAYNIAGIGIDEAQHIAYMTLCGLYPTADYQAARDVSIQAAADLYGGVCSPEVISVANAWYAVGVGDQFGPTIPVNFTYKTVDSDMTVINCGDINVEMVVIVNKAKLKLDTPGKVTINSNFEMQLGTELKIK